MITLFDTSFYCLAFGTLLTSILLVHLKNPIRVLLCFFILMIHVSGFIMLLDATFLAIFFLLVSTLLSMPLLIFHMMTQKHSSKKESPISFWYKGVSSFLVLFFIAELIFLLIYKMPSLFTLTFLSLNGREPSSKILGELIYTDYISFIFYLGLLLFSALIGVILIIAPRKTKALKPASVTHLYRNTTSVQLQDLKFSTLQALNEKDHDEN